MNFQTFFALGMKRYIPDLLAPAGVSIDVGASGKYRVPGATMHIGSPDWLFPRDHLPVPDDSVAVIHAYHFLEHLSGADAVLFLREVERVLKPGGVLSFSVPYFSSSLSAQDLDHKSQWCEDTFSNLFENDTYDHFGKWQLNVHFLMVAGIAHRNLALLGQLIKGPRPKGPSKWYYPTEIK